MNPSESIYKKHFYSLFQRNHNIGKQFHFAQNTLTQDGGLCHTNRNKKYTFKSNINLSLILKNILANYLNKTLAVSLQTIEN